MGLDIYFHRVKNKEAYLMYSKSVDVFGEFEDRYYKAHKEVFDKDWTVWKKWHDELNDSDLDYDEFIKSNPEPHFYYWDYLTEEEAEEKKKLNEITAKYKEEAGYEQDEIGDLYMRKKNWMVKYVETRHPELLANDEKFGLILKDSEAVLDIDDITELVRRMDLILCNWKDFLGEESDEHGFYTEEYKNYFQKLIDEHRDLAEKLLPTCSRFFFGDTTYDWYYYTSMRYYRDEFKKELELMEKDGHVLVYRESW